MQTPWDCLPCFLKQASMVAKTTGASRESEESMVRGALKVLADADFRVPPPHIAEKMYPALCAVAGTHDPYREAKRHYNELAMSLADQLEPRCRESEHPLRMLVKLALAGNVIDYGVSDTFDLDGTIERMLAGEPDVDEIDRLEARLASARRVLYLADNAGEIAFDRLLIEHGIGPSRVTLAVRGGPIINDVTREDAEQVGLAKLVPVIDSGVAVPGTALERSSDVFVRAFEEADLILSKGQGNFETLESRRDPRVFYVFMIKCRAVGKLSGYPVKSSVAAFGDRFFLG